MDKINTLPKSITVAVIIAALAVPFTAFADSCPYCGREYGDPMPGDEERVYELRRRHEEECRRRHEQQGQSQSPDGYSGDRYTSGGHRESFDYDAFFRQKQEQALEKQRQLRAQQLREEEILRAGSERVRKQQFQKNKQELLSTLKGADTAPGPALSGTAWSGLQLKSSATKPSADAGTVKAALKRSYIETRQSMADKVKEKLLEEALKPFPGATYVKGLYDRYQEIRREMEELNLNIFQYAMKGMNGGVENLASSSLSDGGFSDRYEEGRESLFGDTAMRVRKWLKKEIEK